jgi:hypothetical protein
MCILNANRNGTPHIKDILVVFFCGKGWNQSTVTTYHSTGALSKNISMPKHLIWVWIQKKKMLNIFFWNDWFVISCYKKNLKTGGNSLL